MARDFRRFARFIAVGILNTGIGYALFLLVSLAGLAYPLTIFISTSLGVAVNFFTTGRIVFLNKRNALIFRFILAYGLVYLVNIGSTALIKTVLDNVYVIQAALAFPLAMLTYLLQRSFVFSTTAGGKSLERNEHP